MKTEGTGGSKNIAKDFARHTLQGWYSRVGAPSEGHLPVVLTDGHSYGLATSGTTQELPSGGGVVIVGRPLFRNSALAGVARKAGAAAAVAQGYAEYSQDIFSHLYGSFCCAIVDASANRTLIGIDRLGQHSLYYTQIADGLLFGSSAHSVLTQDKRKHALLSQGLYNYLYFHMVPGPGSVYQDLKKLQAAHYLEFQGGQSRIVNYWHPEFTESTKDDTASLSHQLMQTMREAVENCLPESGKIGSFLSGGLDSSTVTGLLAEASNREAEAFSIGFSAEGYDEMAFARITAKHFGVKLNEYYVTPEDVVEALPFIATSYDEPFGNSSALPAYFCAKMAAEHNVSTLLAGDGGDEIFAGNERYIKQRAFQHYHKVPGVLRKGLLEPIIRNLPGAIPLASKARSYIAQANTPLPDRLQSYNFLHRHAASDIFAESFLAEVNVGQPLELLRSIYHRPEDATELNRMLYLDWQITLADNDLRKVSHMCDLAGVEVVYPMLDDALVEFSAIVPSALKIHGGDLRHFFKQTTQSWLPEATINKSKQGFGLPFGVWMQSYEPLRELAYDNLLSLKKREFIKPDFIDETIRMHQSEHAAYYGELVWIFTVFELWMQGKVDRQNPLGA